MSYTPIAKECEFDPDVDGLFYTAWHMEDVADCMAENGYLDEDLLNNVRLWDYGKDEKVDEVCDYLERNEIIDDLLDSKKVAKKIVKLVDQMCEAEGFKRMHKAEDNVIFVHCTGGRYIGSVEWFKEDILEIIDALGYEVNLDDSNDNDVIMKIGDKIYNILTDGDMCDDVESAIVTVCRKLCIEKV